MKYIIMCGGKYQNWEEPKQLQQIKGEPIVARTIRLLRENKVGDIAISATDDRFKKFGVPVLKHNNTFLDGDGVWLDAFYPIDEPVCYLYGDVIYSPAAIKTIVDRHVPSIEFFASCPPYAEGYIKHWEEPFAFKVNDPELFRHCIEVTKHYDKSGLIKRPEGAISWELWQVIKGTPLNEVLYNYVVINDYTCDIDSMEDIDKIGGYIE